MDKSYLPKNVTLFPLTIAESWPDFCYTNNVAICRSLRVRNGCWKEMVYGNSSSEQNSAHWNVNTVWNPLPTSPCKQPSQSYFQWCGSLSAVAPLLVCPVNNNKCLALQGTVIAHTTLHTNWCHQASLEHVSLWLISRSTEPVFWNWFLSKYDFLWSHTLYEVLAMLLLLPGKVCSLNSDWRLQYRVASIRQTFPLGFKSTFYE